MNQRTSAEVLGQLYAVREKVHSAIETSVRDQLNIIAQLDEVIQKLEADRDGSGGRPSIRDILTMFETVIEALPAVAQLLEFLRNGR